jgi:GNAT superfamily N-acetyltransferase
MADRAVFPDPDAIAASDRGSLTKLESVVFELATPADALALAELRALAARELTEQYGHGHWSGEPTERGARAELRYAQVWIARDGRDAVGTFRLATRKPWAIDTSYFTECRRPLYLTSMAVRPDFQRRGLGRRCVEKAVRAARAWPADAIRLDAYDADAGAGAFYLKCGFRETGRKTYRSDPLIYYELILPRVD